MIVKLPLSPKLKLIGNAEFNHLTIILTLLVTCGPKLPLNKWGPTRDIVKFFNLKWEVQLKKIQTQTTCFDPLINYHFIQKLKVRKS
jgi:hypothetical protein